MPKTAERQEQGWGWTDNVSKSPCLSCALASYDKSNTACMQCKARVMYLVTQEMEFERMPTPRIVPPKVDIAAVVWETSPAQATYELTVVPDVCKTSGCDRKPTKRTGYCWRCNARRAYREKKGIPLDNPPRYRKYMGSV